MRSSSVCGAVRSDRPAQALPARALTRRLARAVEAEDDHGELLLPGRRRRRSAACMFGAHGRAPRHVLVESLEEVIHPGRGDSEEASRGGGCAETPCPSSSHCDGTPRTAQVPDLRDSRVEVLVPGVSGSLVCAARPLRAARGAEGRGSCSVACNKTHKSPHATLPIYIWRSITRIICSKLRGPASEAGSRCRACNTTTGFIIWCPCRTDRSRATRYASLLELSHISSYLNF
jgi:hypothetical protein